MKISDNAQEIIESRYLWLSKGETSWDDIAKRSALVIGGATNNPDKYIPLFYDMISNLTFIPAGRILRNAGRPRGSMFNCYCVPLGDSIEEIMDGLAACGKLWKDGGGTGLNLSPLRPRGSNLVSSEGFSSGPLPFLHGFNEVGRSIETGGQRRAAGLALLNINHPDIEAFIQSKADADPLKFDHFNLSVAITEDFIDAVRMDSTWPLLWHNKVLWELPAIKLWNILLHNLSRNGEPGILNWNKISENNSYYYAPIVATNPCIHGDSLIQTTMGEIPIKDLTQYQSVEVYTKDQYGRLCIKPARFFRTKTKARIITVNTTRGLLKCTEDHRFITPDGEIKAIDLIPGQNLIGLLRRKRNETHVEVKLTGENSYLKEEQLVMSYYFGNSYLNSNYNIHHLDGNPTNNSIQNLQILPHYIHSILSNMNHEQWNETNELGQFVKKDEKKSKTKSTFSASGTLPWKVVSVDTNIEYAPVFDGQVEDTHCYIANGVLVHNCGEAPLEAWGVCNLGSLVLKNFVLNGRVQWKQLEETIHLANRFLDTAIDVNPYTLPEIKQTAQRGRRIGIGVMGLADMLFDLNIRYGSKEALDFSERLFKFIRNCCYESSIKLAVEKGSFPAFDANMYGKAKFIRTLPPSIRTDIRKYGIRNVTLMAMAPTGTIALIPECVGGIEPLPYKAYKREDNVSTRYYIHPKYKEILLGKEINNNDIDVSYFVDSCDLRPIDHIELQGVVQKYTDGAVSKTILIPKDFEDASLSDILLESISDLKGVTVYRDGSREGQPLVPLTDEESLVVIHAGSNSETIDTDLLKCASGSCEV